MSENESEIEDSVSVDLLPSSSTAPIYSSAEIKKQLALKEFSAIPKENAKSLVWIHFSQVVDKSRKCLGFAQCNKCQDILRYDSNTGTSSLKRHSKSCKPSLAVSQTIKIDSIFPHSVNKSPECLQAKKILSEALIHFCSKDLRPFNVVNGIGFQKLIGAAIDIGAKYGKIPVESITPDPTTISRNVIAMATKVLENLKPEISEVFKTVGGAVTIDFWTDDFKILDVLMPFKRAILSLEVTSTPTLHLVWLIRQDLLDGLKVLTRDPPSISSLKIKLFNVLQTKFVLDDLHKMATYLHPSFKGLYNIASIFEKQEIEGNIQNLLVVTNLQVPDDHIIRDNEKNSSLPYPPAKRRATDALFEKFGSYVKDTNSCNELDLYSREEAPKVDDVLQWWKISAKKLPKLSMIARKVLSVPASSSASECAFSAAGRTVTDLRSSLSADTLHSLLFCYYNL